MTRPFGNRASEATSDRLWHDDGVGGVCGLNTVSITGFAKSPAPAKTTGEAATDKRSRFRPDANLGHRMVRLAANNGAATIDAPAAPRTSHKLTPISAASVTMPIIQRNLS